MFSDYYFVRREHLDTNELYSASSEGLYYYTYGINWWAYVAYIVGILINAVGFAGAVGAHVLSIVTKIYQLNFFLGIIISSGLYSILHKLSPVKIYLNNEEKLPSSEVNTNTHVEYFWSNRDYIDVNG